jgi:hypothetical protein
MARGTAYTPKQDCNVGGARPTISQFPQRLNQARGWRAARLIERAKRGSYPVHLAVDRGVVWFSRQQQLLEPNGYGFNAHRAYPIGS